MVGTKPTDFPVSKARFLQSRYAEIVAYKGIDEGGNSFVLEDMLPVLLDVKTPGTSLWGGVLITFWHQRREKRGYCVIKE